MSHQLTPLRNNIVFQFRDEVNRHGQFVEAMSSRGLFMTASLDDSAKRPRWGKVTAVGPACTFVKPGDMILLPSLRWTERAKLDGQSYWKTNEDEVVARIGEGSDQLEMANNWLLFDYVRDGFAQLSSGIYVKSENETPSGTVRAAGPKVLDDLMEARVYYDGALFHNRIYHNQKDYGFIRVTDVLGYSTI